SPPSAPAPASSPQRPYRKVPSAPAIQPTWTNPSRTQSSPPLYSAGPDSEPALRKTRVPSFPPLESSSSLHPASAGLDRLASSRAARPGPVEHPDYREDSESQTRWDAVSSWPRT